MKNIDLDHIYNCSFGLWVSGLFSAISTNYPEITFEQHKELFFLILTQWLDEGKIVFCTPENQLSEIWKTETKEIVDYLKNRWPEKASHEHDLDLNFYFYDIPAILWVKEDGTLIGS